MPTPLKDSGKAGSGKRLIYKAGGGRKALRTWRSLDKSTRKRIKSSAASLPGYDIKATLGNIRVDRLRGGRGAISNQLTQGQTRVKNARKLAKMSGWKTSAGSSRSTARSGGVTSSRGPGISKSPPKEPMSPLRALGRSPKRTKTAPPRTPSGVGAFRYY